ncbi:hypothetical protein DIPPA_18230 [Diplonema papillatum]|nr:hypothetical protein DIPPA_18230 [Diplonema papillatum]
MSDTGSSDDEPYKRRFAVPSDSDDDDSDSDNDDDSDGDLPGVAEEETAAAGRVLESKPEGGRASPAAGSARGEEESSEDAALPPSRGHPALTASLCLSGIGNEQHDARQQLETQQTPEQSGLQDPTLPTASLEKSGVDAEFASLAIPTRDDDNDRESHWSRGSDALQDSKNWAKPDGEAEDTDLTEEPQASHSAPQPAVQTTPQQPPQQQQQQQDDTISAHPPSPIPVVKAASDSDLTDDDSKGSTVSLSEQGPQAGDPPKAAARERAIVRELEEPSPATETAFTLSPVTPYNKPGSKKADGTNPASHQQKQQSPPIPPSARAAPVPVPSLEPKPAPARRGSQGSERPAPAVRLTKAHTLRVADQKKRVLAGEEKDRQLWRQAVALASGPAKGVASASRLGPAAPSRRKNASSPAPPHAAPPPDTPPTKPSNRHPYEVLPTDSSEHHHHRPKDWFKAMDPPCKTTPVVAPRSRSAPARAHSPVRLPSPVAAAGRYTARPSDLVEGGHRDTASRLDESDPAAAGQAAILRECVRQKEAMREERLAVLADLNEFLQVYAGDSPAGGGRPAGDGGGKEDWERRRIVGKALFTRSTPPRTRAGEQHAPGSPGGILKQLSAHAARSASGTPPFDGGRSRSPVSVSWRELREQTSRPHAPPAQPSPGRAAFDELKPESWRDAAKRQHLAYPKSADGTPASAARSTTTPPGPRHEVLFKAGVALAVEKRKWADSERTKDLAKKHLRAEADLTFRPAISEKSRALEAASGGRAARDRQTRLPPRGDSPRREPPAPHPNQGLTTHVFGRTTCERELVETRAGNGAAASRGTRSSSAPAPPRVQQLARPKQQSILADIARAFNDAQAARARPAPVDEKLLLKREHELGGKNVSQYLFNHSVDKSQRRAEQEKNLSRDSRQGSNVGQYLTQSSRELANKRKRERLVHLFNLLDIDGAGRVTQVAIEQADAALRSVSKDKLNAKEGAILQALSEVATILRTHPADAYTVDSFVEALSDKISRRCPLSYLHPDTREPKPADPPPFNPVIDEKSRRLAGRSRSATGHFEPDIASSAGEGEVHDRLYGQAAATERKRELREQQREVNELAGATFRPKLNTQSNAALLRKKRERELLQRYQRGGGGRPPGSPSIPTDVLCHIDSIVGEAAAWLRAVGSASPERAEAAGDAYQKREPARRHGAKHRRSASAAQKQAAAPAPLPPADPAAHGRSPSYSVSPPTPARVGVCVVAGGVSSVYTPVLGGVGVGRVATPGGASAGGTPSAPGSRSLRLADLEPANSRHAGGSYRQLHELQHNASTARSGTVAQQQQQQQLQQRPAVNFAEALARTPLISPTRTPPRTQGAETGHWHAHRHSPEPQQQPRPGRQQQEEGGAADAAAGPPPAAAPQKLPPRSSRPGALPPSGQPPAGGKSSPTTSPRLLPSRTRARKSKRREITLSSLHSASPNELAEAGRLLMQQQLMKHRLHSR